MILTDANILSASRPAAAPLPSSIAFEELVMRLPARERGAVLRHEAACEELDPSHAELWRRIVCRLATLAPHAVRALGQHALQFFVADGKYRRQVYAMDDHRDSKLVVYAPDMLEMALKEGVVLPPPDPAEPRAFGMPGARGVIYLESLDAANTSNPDASFKYMLGWNRRALRTTLLTTATPPQIDTAERLWSLAAREWESAKA